MANDAEDARDAADAGDADDTVDGDTNGEILYKEAGNVHHSKIVGPITTSKADPTSRPD